MSIQRTFIAFGLMALTVLINSLISPDFHQEPEPISIPDSPDGWTGSSWDFEDYIPPPDLRRLLINRQFHHSSLAPVYVLLERRTFRSHRGNKLPYMCMMARGWDIMEKKVVHHERVGLFKKASMEQLLIKKNQVLWYVQLGFVIGDQIVPDGIQRKLSEVLFQLRFGKIDTTFVLMATPINLYSPEEAFKGQYRLLEALSPSLVDMDTSIPHPQS